MNPFFKGVPDDYLYFVEDSLTNDNESTDEELVEYFIGEFYLTSEQADAAVGLRSQYLSQRFQEGHGPLHRLDPLPFDPTTRTYH